VLFSDTVEDDRRAMHEAGLTALQQVFILSADVAFKDLFRTDKG
jgi:hypothetical protein